MNPLLIGELKAPVPIVQGGMGIGVSLSGLAAAVANMGGIGIIATVGLGLIHGENKNSFRKNNILGLRKEIRAARKLTDGILGVNIMTVLSNQDDLVRTATEEGIDIIFSGAGLPLDLPRYKKDGNKTKLVPIVSSARAASIITNRWKRNFDYLPDAFVVEGPKAGGHLGFSHENLEKDPPALEDLVIDTLQVSQDIYNQYNKKVPVIAAGGISSGEDIFHFLNLGASGVQLGSLFIATQECDASIQFKEAIIRSDIEDVRLIKSPVGMPGRAVYNDFLKSAGNGEKKPTSCKYGCIKSCDPKTTSYCITDALLAAYRGDLNNGFVFTGANAPKIKFMSTVPEVFNQLKREYELCKQMKLSC